MARRQIWLPAFHGLGFRLVMGVDWPMLKVSLPLVLLLLVVEAAPAVGAAVLVDAAPPPHALSSSAARTRPSSARPDGADRVVDGRTFRRC